MFERFDHVGRDKRRYIATERGNLANDRARDIAVLRRTHDKNGLQLAIQAIVKVGLLQLILKVGHGAQALDHGTRPLLIAVTQLTSTDQERMERELLIHAPLEEVVLSYAANAAAAGLDGVVCSPLEAGAIHRRCGASFLTVTPGVRFAGGDAGDQKRVTTPAKARELDSDYIVVGRPITQAENPVAAYRRCVREFVD